MGAKSMIIQKNDGLLELKGSINSWQHDFKEIMTRFQRENKVAHFVNARSSVCVLSNPVKEEPVSLQLLKIRQIQPYPTLNLLKKEKLPVNPEYPSLDL